MRTMKIVLAALALPVLLAACGSDDTVTERTTTTPGTYSDTVTTERKTTIDD
ncbi:hypothetical protein IGS68_08775 [Skermanella sp. TT6]|uniref:Lipoprotein n=1 Tax=Skermanella cutis TaxID=2775420 RepID=A0ABX7BC19_9PROT|nr:hypothetical protein [Skermanella sp. TT6]QQP91280.1 hypothetical protein IGS68_08775 [Skermanella sp. TT6]